MVTHPQDVGQSQSLAKHEPTMESKLLALIAWVFGLIGVIVVLLIELVTKREDRFVRFWLSQAIGFVILEVVASVLSFVLLLIPIIGWLLLFVIGLAMFVIWLLGIYYTLTGRLQRPIVVSLISEKIEPILLK